MLLSPSLLLLTRMGSLEGSNCWGNGLIIAHFSSVWARLLILGAHFSSGLKLVAHITLTPGKGSREEAVAVQMPFASARSQLNWKQLAARAWGWEKWCHHLESPLWREAMSAWGSEVQQSRPNLATALHASFAKDKPQARLAMHVTKLPWKHKDCSHRLGSGASLHGAGALLAGTAWPIAFAVPSLAAAEENTA